RSSLALRLAKPRCPPAADGCTSVVVPNVNRVGAAVTFQSLGEIGTRQMLRESASVAEISTPAPSSVQASGAWLADAKPICLKAAAAPVPTTAPVSKSATHQSTVPSLYSFGLRLPRKRMCRPSGVQSG